MDQDGLVQDKVSLRQLGFSRDLFKISGLYYEK